MQDSIKLSRVEPILQDISYPTTRRDAADAFDGVTLLFADGNADLGDVIRTCFTDEFVDSRDLFYELNNALPIEALGEPGQSDGDA
ncbi:MULTISPECIES: hypothetical protein [Haloferax]|uniref:DUF2795 domain-containing protein n=1 Tax=Haloferax marinum TaxID=2666143 RepID=A0A6A8G2K0_9EURY|nr:MULTISPECIES: hypothetical protein [Haloferax]KAB1196391.1 hypothetical protein Hfx1150_02195 [Haloferax sp. CBA1150]MRW95384.1 hypothetical protein [Haloferax marinum]